MQAHAGKRVQHSQTVCDHAAAFFIALGLPRPSSLASGCDSTSVIAVGTQSPAICCLLHFLQAMLHRPAPLTVPGVFATLRQLAAEKGQGEALLLYKVPVAMLVRCLIGHLPLHHHAFSPTGACAFLSAVAALLSAQVPRAGDSALSYPCSPPAARASLATSPARWCRQVFKWLIACWHYGPLGA